MPTTTRGMPDEQLPLNLPAPSRRAAIPRITAESAAAERTFLSGKQVAALLGVSRRTVYRWADRGRIPPPWDWRAATIAPLAGIGHLPKGPPRRRTSLRYTVYRHRFDRLIAAPLIADNQ